jgi:hypothetical protein
LIFTEQRVFMKKKAVPFFPRENYQRGRVGGDAEGEVNIDVKQRSANCEGRHHSRTDRNDETKKCRVQTKTRYYGIVLSDDRHKTKNQKDDMFC